MRLLLLALGNPWRRDDGVAASVLSLVVPRDGAERLVARQPVTDMATTLDRYDDVVFVDSDATAPEVTIVPLEGREATEAPIGHTARPRELVTLARKAFGYKGNAWLCRVPMPDLGENDEQGPETQRHVRFAAEMLHQKFPHAFAPTAEAIAD